VPLRKLYLSRHNDIRVLLILSLFVLKVHTEITYKQANKINTDTNTKNAVKSALIKQDAQLSQRDRAAGRVIVLAKRRRLELGDNILQTL